MKRELVLRGAKWGAIASLLGSLMFGIPAVAMMVELTREPINSYLEMSISDLLQFLFLFVGIPGFAVSLISLVVTVIPGATGGALLAIWFDSLIPQLSRVTATSSDGIGLFPFGGKSRIIGLGS
jgi:hypothetical protein